MARLDRWIASAWRINTVRRARSGVCSMTLAKASSWRIMMAGMLIAA